MPMTAAERATVQDTVAAVLREQIHEQFVDFYAAAVALNERQPDQVNNEIRNALTHLSRALCADTAQSAAAEIKRAEQHIDRARRDAIKLAVFELRDRIHAACAEIRMVHGALSSAFVLRREELTEKRKQLVKAEAAGSDDVMEGFVELFIEAQALEKDLINTFDIAYARIPRWKVLRVWFQRQLTGIVFGLAIGLIGSLIFTILVPDQTGFGNKVRQLIGLDRPSAGAPPRPPAASSPSTGETPEPPS